MRNALGIPGEAHLAEQNDYPYVNEMDVRFPALAQFDVPALAAACEHQWFNQTLCRINDSVLRYAVVQGEYHWHKHDVDDELFFTLDGCLFVDTRETTFELQPGQGVVIPRGVEHRTHAVGRTVILMVETADIVPTGD
jgi:mannose-6-phosphate isomerase-like protein (cupin superfamily)